MNLDIALHASSKRLGVTCLNKTIIFSETVSLGLAEILSKQSSMSITDYPWRAKFWCFGGRSYTTV